MEGPHALLLRSRREHRGRGQLASLERTVLALHAALLVTIAALMLLPLLSHPVPMSAVGLRVSLGLLEMVVAVDLLRSGEQLWHLAVFAVAFVFVVPIIQVHPEPGDVGSIMTSSACALSAIRLFSPRRYVYILGAFGVTYFIVRLLAGPGTGFAEELDGFLLGGAMTFAAGALIDALEAGTANAVTLDEAAARQERELQRSRDEAMASDAARRVLHDEVLSALRAVSEGSLQTAERTRNACRLAVSSVHSITGSR